MMDGKAKLRVPAGERVGCRACGIRLPAAACWCLLLHSKQLQPVVYEVCCWRCSRAGAVCHPRVDMHCSYVEVW